MRRFFLEETQAKRIFNLTDLLEKYGCEVVIGRQEGKPDICLGNWDLEGLPKRNLKTVSREHARLTYEHERIYLQDNSKNGTKVNGKPIDELTLLRNGDEIFLGDYGPLIIREQI